VKKNSYDQLLMWVGAVLCVVFVACAGLAYWGGQFADEQVSSQLTQEKIYFPKAGSPALDPQEFPGLQQYAGQQIDTGDKAKAYADEFIWHHMMKASGGKTYAEVSEEAMANPTDQKLAGLKGMLFQGDMLRSSLLTAYAFSRFGLVAQYAVIVCLVGAGIMLLLALGATAQLRRK
jgi:hypothetical protein